jgi:hypothetical protein
VRRVAISAFLLAHVGATVLWVMPPCPIRAYCFGTLTYYMLPLGLWQSWTMFAPDPLKESVTLEAEVVDNRGMRHGFAFTKLADFSKWRGVPRFRHAKYAANLTIPELELNRRFAACHVVRQLALPDEAFPVNVHLIFQLRLPPPPGGPPADAMTPSRPHTFGSFYFASPSEVKS